MPDYLLFAGSRRPCTDFQLELPPAPPWRRFPGPRTAEEYDRRVFAPDSYGRDRRRGETYQVNPPEKDAGGVPDEVSLVNAALTLRRPLLVTGNPGAGKSSLASAVAWELQLGPVLRWPITSRSTLQEGLYRYDAIGRLQEFELGGRRPVDIGRFVQLGPLGTALLPRTRPRVLLIDEIDKGDVDLPNDLLHLFEEGEFEIPELARLAHTPRVEVRVHDSQVGEEQEDSRVSLVRGRVRCLQFPFVVLTSNGEREFPPAFLRRCVRLTLEDPGEDRLRAMIEAHFAAETSGPTSDHISDLVETFVNLGPGTRAADQLLNALHVRGLGVEGGSWDRVRQALLRSLTEDR